MEEVIYQGPGVLIIRTDVASTMSHYHGMSPEELAIYGHDRGPYVDLINSPELIDTIPELKRSAGLRKMVEAVTGDGSRLCSISCDVNQFERAQVDGQNPRRFHVGGYSVYVIKDEEEASNVDANAALARWIISNISAPPSPLFVCFEFSIEPLKHFYGKLGYFGLMAKAVGFGETPETAWESFEWAATELATSIARDREFHPIDGEE